MLKKHMLDVLVFFGRGGPPALRISNAGCHCLRSEKEDLGFCVLCWERKVIRAKKIADGRVPLRQVRVHFGKSGCSSGEK